MMFDEDRLMAVRDQWEAWLNQQRGLTGTGIGLDRGGNVCLKIFTNHMSPETRSLIAGRLAGVPLDFDETGEIKAF